MCRTDGRRGKILFLPVQAGVVAFPRIQDQVFGSKSDGGVFHLRSCAGRLFDGLPTDRTPPVRRSFFCWGEAFLYRGELGLYIAEILDERKPDDCRVSNVVIRAVQG